MDRAGVRLNDARGQNANRRLFHTTTLTSHNGSTRSRLNDNKYLGIIATYMIEHSTLNHSSFSLMESQPIDLKNESNRLATFTGWPLSFIISPKSLAAAGFYYTKHTDKVKCAFCNICVCRWEFGDNAVDEHKRHNPNCSFILSQDCGNIPVIEGIQLRGEFVETHKETGEPIDIQGLGVRAHQVAFHLNYNSFAARLKSFKGWKNESQKPEDLAIAGFFFSGSNDEVRCYYCDGGLQNWEMTDNPWVEHAKWFPNCGFLNLVKGEKFLDGNLVERFNALLNRSSNTSSSSQEGNMVSIHQTDDTTLNGTSSSTTGDQQISDLMVLPEAMTALQLGLQPDHIRQAIRNNIQDIGRPFRRTDSFIQQILVEVTLPVEGDSVTIEDFLQREAALLRPNTFDSQSLSDESNSFDSSESSEDFDLIIESEENSDNEELRPSDQNTTNTENETSGPNEIAIEADSMQISQSSNIDIKEKVNEPIVETENIKLSQSDLEEENRRLKEARLCKICLDQELGVVMLPCAHLVACITCASSLPDCPLCRQTIKATVRTFLS
ncbi:death-associated inhibitor of apoptosis 2-like [Sipha flava]|uniref:Death-associated inhibitor of apoptosis 2-like n=1 Tax=Sipha flava TaxID=143950 RepID=A0A8B8FVQ1_9HEMI|nr:death-associated inhibitor of apoptosis 2-like [Sipha flava]